MSLRFWLTKKFIGYLARSQGFLDPIHVFSAANRFSQPSEVIAPAELVRSAVILHARGPVNALAIQHHLDWVWPSSNVTLRKDRVAAYTTPSPVHRVNPRCTLRKDTRLAVDRSGHAYTALHLLTLHILNCTLVLRWYSAMLAFICTFIQTTQLIHNRNQRSGLY